jgi:hypothetical protein
VFQAGVGYRGLVSVDHQYLHPPGTTLHLAIGEGGRSERLHSVRIDDGPRAGRRWTPFEVDLSAYAGRDVTLRLEVEAERPLPPGALAWWGSPRIAVRPPPARASGAPGSVTQDSRSTERERSLPEASRRLAVRAGRQGGARRCRPAGLPAGNPPG